MKATFLQADVPLTKTFYREGDEIKKIGHPSVRNYTSHEVKYKNLEELTKHFKHYADLNYCFLKGNLIKQLVQESRAGTTDPNQMTQLICFDLDGIKSVSDIPQYTEQTGLKNVDYIVQYSSSMGIIPEKGLSAHVFMLLDQPYAPAVLKQYLIRMNLSIPLLRSNLGLTATYNALRWSLDITTCQNDKLIYIAPPIVKGDLEDTFKGERIQFVKGKHRYLALPQPFPNAETNREQAEEALNKLREDMGLSRRTKTVTKTHANVEYMAKPDQAVVTGIKVKEDFTYLNLNGGDSWGYYHPTNNPTFIFNFKNEPTYKTSELLPDYWKDAKEAITETKPDAKGRVFLAFRDFRTSAYYNGIFYPDKNKLTIAQAKSESQLRHFLAQYNQPFGEYIPDWELIFDPRSPTIVDSEKQVVNTFKATEYMLMKPKKILEVPPTIRKVLFHMVGDDEDLLEHLLNSLAVMWQYRVKTGTAWVFHGVEGTGKGLFFNNILRPLFGMNQVVGKRIREIDSGFNGYAEHAMVLWIDEAEQSDFKDNGMMNADLKNYVTEPKLSIRRMYTDHYEADNYMTVFLASNKGHVIRIDITDRRFNVCRYQENALIISQEEIDQMAIELVDFAHYLSTRVADRDMARKPMNNEAKRTMIELNRTAIDMASDAINSGNLEFFWNQMPQVNILKIPSDQRGEAEAYIALVKHIVAEEPKCLLREELYTLLKYTVGNIPSTPIKFTSMVKHHRLAIGPVRRNGTLYRGIKTNWKIKPEWKEK